MEPDKLYFTIRVLVLLSVVTGGFQFCVPSCECHHTSSDVIVTCTGPNITNVPTELPANTTKL